jgi:hypothetical protein
MNHIWAASASARVIGNPTEADVRSGASRKHRQHDGVRVVVVRSLEVARDGIDHDVRIAQQQLPAQHEHQLALAGGCRQVVERGNGAHLLIGSMSSAPLRRSQNRRNDVPRRSVGNSRQSSSAFSSWLAPSRQLETNAGLVSSRVTVFCATPSTPGSNQEPGNASTIVAPG